MASDAQAASGEFSRGMSEKMFLGVGNMSGGFVWAIFWGIVIFSRGENFGVSIRNFLLITFSEFSVYAVCYNLCTVMYTEN